MPSLYTTHGLFQAEEAGMILPHEHIFVDLRTPDVPGQGEGEATDVIALMKAGYEDQILLSMDRGWYDPAQTGGGTPKPFTLLGDVFLPKLREAGFSDALIHKFTVTNPFNAFER